MIPLREENTSALGFINDLMNNDDLKSLTGNKRSSSKDTYLRGSLSNYAKDLIMTFPCMCDNAIPITTASLISKANERYIITMLEMLFASAQMHGDTGADVIASVHKNIKSNFSIDDYLDALDNYVGETTEPSKIEIATALREMVTQLKQPTVSFPSSSFSESSLNDYEFRNRNGIVSLQEAKKGKNRNNNNNYNPYASERNQREIERNEREWNADARAERDEARKDAAEERARAKEDRDINKERRERRADARAERDEARKDAELLLKQNDEWRKDNAAMKLWNDELRAEWQEQRAQAAEGRAQAEELRKQAQEERAQAEEFRRQNNELRAQAAERRAQNAEKRAEAEEKRAEAAEKRAENVERRAEAEERRREEKEKREIEKNERERRADARAELKARNELFEKRLLDVDVKKANELQPSLMIVNFNTLNTDGKIYDTTSFVAGVKSRLISVDSMDIIERIAAKNTTKINFTNFIKATTGEIRFVKDFLLSVDQAKIDAKNASKKGMAAMMWKTLENRAIKNNWNRIKRSGNDASAISILVISQETANALLKYHNFDITKIKDAKFVMDTYNLMGIVICDESIEAAKFLYAGNDNWEVQAYSYLEKEGKQATDYKKTINLLNKGVF